MLKYTSYSSNKANYRKPYNKKDDTLVNVVESSNQDKINYRKLAREMYQFMLNPNWILEDYLEKGLIKWIQGNKYGPNDAKHSWYKEN